MDTQVAGQCSFGSWRASRPRAVHTRTPRRIALLRSGHAAESWSRRYDDLENISPVGLAPSLWVRGASCASIPVTCILATSSQGGTS